MRRTWTPLRPGPLNRHDADRLNQAMAELFQQVNFYAASPLNFYQGPSGPVLTLNAQAVRNAPPGSTVEYGPGTTIQFDSGSILKLIDGSTIKIGDGSGGGGAGSGPSFVFYSPTTWNFQSYGPFVWNNLAEWDINGTGPVIYNLPVTFNYPVSLNTPLSICGSMYWCCYSVPQWTWATYTSGLINNWTIPSSKTVYLISGNLGGSSNNPLTLTGIAPVTVSGSAKPLVIALVNVGTVPIWITDQSGNSSVGNRFALPGNGTSPAPTLVLDPGAAIIIWYDTCSGTGVWRVLSHSYTQFQGAGTYHCQGVVPDPGATAHNPAYVLLDSGGWGKLLGTKGDLLVTDGTSLNQLAVGTDGYVLTADSTQTNGVKWAAASGGSGAVNGLPAHKALATANGASTTSVTTASVTLNPGDMLIVHAAATSTSLPSSVTWNGNTYVLKTSSTGTGISVATTYYVIEASQAGSGTVTVTYAASQTAIAVSVESISGLQQQLQSSSATGNGSGTAASAGPPTPGAGRNMYLGAVATAGTSADGNGTWTGLTYSSTDGNGTIKLQTGYATRYGNGINPDSRPSGAMTLTVSRNWAEVVTVWI